MRTSRWSGLAVWLAVVVILGSLLGAVCSAHGQCAGGMCPVFPPSYDYGWRPSVPEGHYTQPRPYVCRIKSQAGRAASFGSGTLVCVGQDYGAVITCAHLFSDGTSRVTVTFPNGKEFAGELSVKDRSGELAIVKITPRPEILVAKIATDHPVQGDRLTFAGYGPDGRYREVTGVLNGYRSTDGGRHQTLDIQGSARQGDSGGPIFNAQGELVGVLWGTGGGTTVGSYNGRICEFTQTQRYLFPWNADLEREKRRHQNPPQTPPSTPPVSPPTTPAPPAVGSDAQAQQAIGRLQGDVKTLQDRTQGLQTELDGLKTHLREIENEIKGEAVVPIPPAHVAPPPAAPVGDLAEKVSTAIAGSLGTQILGSVKAWSMKLVGAVGIGGGVLAVIVGLLAVRMFRSHAHMIADAVDRLTDIVPGGWDDKLLDTLAYKVADVVGTDVRKQARSEARRAVAGSRTVSKKTPR